MTDAGDVPPPVPAVARRPGPADPGPSQPNPALGEATRARMQEADRQRVAALAAAEPGAHLRTTIGLALGAMALGVAWRLLGPGRE